MKLIEVIAGREHPRTRPCETIKKISTEIGKSPVQVNEAAGFVVNRILIPMINEAALASKTEGVSDIAGIDTAMKLGANHPMGPLELGDLVGLDICLAIMDVLYKRDRRSASTAPARCSARWFAAASWAARPARASTSTMPTAPRPRLTPCNCTNLRAWRSCSRAGLRLFEYMEDYQMDFTLSKAAANGPARCTGSLLKTKSSPWPRRSTQSEYFPKETVEKMAKLGMMGIYFPKEVGGAGGDVLSYVMAVEEMSKVCGTTGVILSAHTSLCAAPIYENGTPAAEGKVPAQAVQRRVDRRFRPDRARCRHRRPGPADLRRVTRATTGS